MVTANVMIVEDESIIAKDIQKSLEDLGYTVTAVAASGEEAIRKVAETRPDLMLIDIVLKGNMDGVEAAEIVRSRFNIPVIYLTAHADENTLERAKITEPYGYLLKPFEERELHTAIQMALYKHQAETRVEDALHQQIEELTVANHTKDEFLAALSHELRTPLSSVLGWARVLRSGNLDKATSARALETIERNVQLQARLVEDLLDVSRIITGKLHLNIRPVELVSIIKSAVETMRPMAEARGIRLDAALDSKAGALSGDPDRLHQVVWNLLSNALKFTPRNGCVEVRLEATEDHVQIKVTDTGQGMSAEMLPHVFDRFRKAEDWSQEPLGRLGLGLSIARHLVELHGGTIQAESPGPRMGSTFTIKLPRKAARIEAADLIAADDAMLGTPPALNGLSVLVMDDEADTRHFLTTVLEQRGARAISVSSVAEAMEVLKRARPDVIISDIRMPDEDGYDLIRRVRSMEPELGGRIPAVALTGYARVEDRLRALSAGYQMHIPKPVEPAELVAVVASLTGRTGTAKA